MISTIRDLLTATGTPLSCIKVAMTLLGILHPMEEDRVRLMAEIILDVREPIQVPSRRTWVISESTHVGD